jgi:BirA family transcriptional regulator, biotin operon repressor / biotin---[acetyl-CoA-carboxylase] ligase
LLVNGSGLGIMAFGEHGQNEEEQADGDGLSAPPFFHLIALAECGSTNDEAKLLAQKGVGEGAMIWTAKQTAGRGRRGRQWSAPDGNLACSLILRPDLSIKRAALISFVAALAMAETIAAMIPGRPSLKWPNDILVDGKKVSGILLEAEAKPEGTVDWLVVGVGLNLAHFPADTPYPSASLAALGAKPDDLDPFKALVIYCRRFWDWYQRFLVRGFDPVRAGWMNAAYGLRHPLTVRLAAETIQGTMLGIDETGCLRVDMGGMERLISAGDVFFEPSLGG